MFIRTTTTPKVPVWNQQPHPFYSPHILTTHHLNIMKPDGTQAYTHTQFAFTLPVQTQCDATLSGSRCVPSSLNMRRVGLSADAEPTTTATTSNDEGEARSRIWNYHSDKQQSTWHIQFVADPVASHILRWTRMNAQTDVHDTVVDICRWAVW